MVRRLLVTLAIVASQLLPTAALAGNDRIEDATALTPERSAVSDTLVGDSGGAYRYFRIAYPGGGVVIPITMRAQPGRGTAGVGTGFKVYGPNGLVGDALGDDRSTTDSTYALTLSSTTPGRYDIQVYNYIQGLPLHFQLNAGNLAPVAPPAPALAPTMPGLVAPTIPGAAPPAPIAPPNVPAGPPANTSPDRAIVIQQSSLTSGGTLAGKRDGAFNYFELDYPGGRTNMTITVGYSPITPFSDKAVGFKLYRRDPTVREGAVIAGESSETGRNESSATVGFTLQADAAERYLLQVYNYLDGVTINYTLIVSGLSGPVADVGDISSPRSAFVLSLAQPAARGSLPGDPAGRFHYYLLDYPGGNREVRITVTAEPNGAIGDNMFGFNLYRGSDTAGIANASVDARGQRTATLTINEGDGRTFGIQVFNYSPGAEARYAIAVTGL